MKFSQYCYSTFYVILPCYLIHITWLKTCYNLILLFQENSDLLIIQTYLIKHWAKGWVFLFFWFREAHDFKGLIFKHSFDNSNYTMCSKQIRNSMLQDPDLLYSIFIGAAMKIIISITKTNGERNKTDL